MTRIPQWLQAVASLCTLVPAWALAQAEAPAGMAALEFIRVSQDGRRFVLSGSGAAFHNRLLPEGNFIGHNKFTVYVDADGMPRTVLTGSTNWTPTGLCAQSNNILIIDDAKVAERYLGYWNLLL